MWQRNYLLIAVVCTCVLRLWLDLTLPITFYWWASHDDGLFMERAQQILLGGWLGPYNHLTLAKGPGYPVFLALAALSGLPVTLVQSLFQLLAIGAAAYVVWRLTFNRAAAAAVFAFLALHPVAFIPEVRRVVREQIYAPQVLLVCCLFFLILFERRLRGRVWLPIAAGLVLGWAWMTREEGIGLLPSLVVLLLAAAYTAARRRRFKDFAKPASLSIGAAIVLVFSVSAINLEKYGIWTISDVKERNFVEAMSALQSIDIGKQPFIPVSAQARQAAAQESPAFAPLAARLEPGGQLAKGWGGPTCRIYPSLCGEIAAGWFLWALRDAASQEGHYRNAPATSEMFGQVAAEVEAACAGGKLPCREGIGLMPPLLDSQWRLIPGAGLEILRHVAFSRTPPRDTEFADVLGKPAGYEKWSFLNYPELSDGVPHRGEGVAQHVRDLLISVYGILAPSLMALGFTGFVLAVLRSIWLRSVPVVLVAAASTWAFVVTRIVLLTAIHVTSFPAANYSYAAPAIYVGCLSGVLSLLAAWELWRMPSSHQEEVAGPT